MVYWFYISHEATDLINTMGKPLGNCWFHCMKGSTPYMTIHQSFLDPSSGDIPVDIGSAAADFSVKLVTRKILKFISHKMDISCQLIILAVSDHSSGCMN